MADSVATGEEEEASGEEGELGHHGGEDSSGDRLEVGERLRFLCSSIGCLAFTLLGALRSVWSPKTSYLGSQSTTKSASALRSTAKRSNIAFGILTAPKSQLLWQAAWRKSESGREAKCSTSEQPRAQPFPTFRT